MRARTSTAEFPAYNLPVQNRLNLHAIRLGGATVDADWTHFRNH
jgi:hypothetical protein